MTLVAVISDVYEDFLTSGDSRVTRWPLMSSPVPIVTLIVMYVLFVKSIGPSWMQNRKPFDLRKPMFLFNAALVFIHLYFVKDGIFIALREIPGGICMVQDKNSPEAMKIAELGWIFFIMKIVEFGDTVFFVLRKKSDHISKLHVIHHAIVPIIVWMIVRFEPVVHNSLFPIVNSLVHSIMYTYYGLSALGPAIQKYLWWKKYLTTLQMVQFVLVIIYQIVLGMSTCKVSKWIIFTIMFGDLFFLILFIDFFRSAYQKSPAKKNID